MNTGSTGVPRAFPLDWIPIICRNCIALLQGDNSVLLDGYVLPTTVVCYSKLKKENDKIYFHLNPGGIWALLHPCVLLQRGQDRANSAQMGWDHQPRIHHLFWPHFAGAQLLSTSPPPLFLTIFLKVIYSLVFWGHHIHHMFPLHLFSFAIYARWQSAK